jgi:hypothetical protein
LLEGSLGVLTQNFTGEIVETFQWVFFGERELSPTLDIVGEKRVLNTKDGNNQAGGTGTMSRLSAVDVGTSTFYRTIDR